MTDSGGGSPEGEARGFLAEPALRTVVEHHNGVDSLRRDDEWHQQDALLREVQYWRASQPAPPPAGERQDATPIATARRRLDDVVNEAVGDNRDHLWKEYEVARDGFYNSVKRWANDLSGGANLMVTEADLRTLLEMSVEAHRDTARVEEIAARHGLRASRSSTPGFVCIEPQPCPCSDIHPVGSTPGSGTEPPCDHGTKRPGPDDWKYLDSMVHGAAGVRVCRVCGVKQAQKWVDVAALAQSGGETPGGAYGETDAVLMAMQAWESTNDGEKFDRACPPIVYGIARRAFEMGRAALRSGERERE
jgi:hypothetical protein